jgi:hypothetical protein
MRGLIAPALLVGMFALVGSGGAQTKPPFKGAAPDFPPGVFTDGGQYHLDDFKGKVLALYFFESG